MTDQGKKKPGPKPDTLKVPLSFEEAVKAALETPPTPKKPRKRRERRK